MNHNNTIDEMCRRLRSCCRWDNQLAERVQALAHAVDVDPKPDRPFHPPILADGTYSKAREQLAAVTAYRLDTCPADVASCLTMAALLYRWEGFGHPAPTVRLGAGGFVVAEWDGKRGGHVMIQHGETFGGCAPNWLDMGVFA